MATQEIVTVLSDLSADPGANTVPFAFGGVSYEIDLTPSEAADFADLMATYVGHARKMEQRVKKNAASKKTDTGPLREWAKANGVDVPARGRIPAEIVERFENAAK